MVYVFVDTKILEQEDAVGFPGPISLAPEALAKCKELGIDPAKLQKAPMKRMTMGYLGDIRDRLEKVFANLGYVSSENLQRKVSKDFLISCNAVYDTKKVGSIYVASRNPYATLVLGAITPPVNDEFVGMVKTEIFEDENRDLVDRVRATYKELSPRYVERTIANLLE